MKAETEAFGKGVDDRFVLNAISSFVEDTMADQANESLSDLVRIDDLVAQLEKSLEASSQKNSIEVSSMLPVLAANSRELMSLISRVRSLSDWHSSVILNSLGLPQESCVNCRELKSEITRLERGLLEKERENQSLREQLSAQQLHRATQGSEGDDGDLQELQSALASVESLQAKFDDFANKQ